MNYKPIQLFHPNGYQPSQPSNTPDDADASQSQQQQQQMQSQLLQYQPFEVKHRKRTSKHQFTVGA